MRSVAETTFFFPPNLHRFYPHKSCKIKHLLDPAAPSCAASITGGPVLPMLSYAQARSMYAPLEMTDGVDSCWQALNMHTRAHCLVQKTMVCLAHTNSNQELTGAPAPLKWRLSSLAGLAGILLQRWAESLGHQQLFSKCHSWESGPFYLIILYLDVWMMLEVSTDYSVRRCRPPCAHLAVCLNSWLLKCSYNHNFMEFFTCDLTKSNRMDIGFLS